MRKRIKYIVMLTTLVALSIVLMGGGNDCPKACITLEAPCALECGGDPDGVCISGASGLECDDTGGGG